MSALSLFDADGRWHQLGRCCRTALLWLFAAAAQSSSKPLSLEETVRLAERESPGLSARQAAIRAAQLQIGPAGALPDPQLLIALENVPVNGSDAGSLTADFMTMRRVGVMQEFPRKRKRALRSERALADAERQEAMLIVERLTIKESAAEAWIARWSAERRHALLVSLRDRYDTLITAADAAVAGGRGSTADALTARSNRAMLEDRLDELSLMVETAQAELARWVSKEAERPLAAADDWTALERSPAAVLAGAGQHRELLVFAATEQAAQAEIALAIAEKQPDWALELSYADRGPLYSDMISVAVRFDLPVFAGKRQDPQIQAKRAALAQLSAEREQSAREYRAALRSTLAAWQTARSRTIRFETELLPLATDRADATLAAYRGSGADLTTAIVALAELVDTQMTQIERHAELGRAWAQLRFAFPESH